MKRFILQAATDEDHLAPAREVFGLTDLNSAVISTAFMTASGLSLLQDVLEPIADRTRLFVGIRNGVTTVQSIQKALEIGCKIYMVDTGSRQRIFHPKLYYARSVAQAKLLLGSANLTMGGLRTNIEASVLQVINIADDEEFIEDLERKLDNLINDYPEHVIEAVDNEQLADLQLSGRLVDEQKTRPPDPVGSSSDRSLDTIPKMALHTTPVSVPRPSAPAVQPQAQSALSGRQQLQQVWESKGLTRRHLNIPTGANTNATGSMLLGVGAWEDIDQRHYFRDDVFSALSWSPDPSPSKAHIERAEANVHLIVKNVDHGMHRMHLSHNSRTDTKSYAQNNSMTQLHWGEAKSLVAREDLLDRTLKLFRDSRNLTHFMLEID